MDETFVVRHFVDNVAWRWVIRHQDGSSCFPKLITTYPNSWWKVEVICKVDSFPNWVYDRDFNLQYDCCFSVRDETGSFNTDWVSIQQIGRRHRWDHEMLGQECKFCDDFRLHLHSRHRMFTCGWWQFFKDFIRVHCNAVVNQTFCDDDPCERHCSSCFIRSSDTLRV